MRRGWMVVLALLAALTAVTSLPRPVNAQLPGPFGILNKITRPFGQIFRGPRASRRQYYSHRAARKRGSTVVQTQPPAATSAAVAGAAAAGTAAVAATAAGTSAEAKPVETKPAAAEVQVEKAAEPTPLPQPRPAEANAAPAASEKPTTASPAPAPKEPAAREPTAREIAPAVTEVAKPAPAGQDATAKTAAAKDATAKDSFAAVTPTSPPAQPAPPAAAVPAVAVTQPAMPAPAPAAPVATVQPAIDAAAAAPSPVVTPAAPPPAPMRAPSPQRSAALQSQGNETPPTTATATQSQQPARGQNRLGFAGPLAWPTAFEDVVGFALWPGEYGERLRGHGIGDVMSVVMVPSKEMLARIPSNVAARTDSKNDAASGGNICNIDPAAEQWPATQIEQQLQLNAKQRDALAQLKQAIRDAAANSKQGCRDEASIAPIERLRAMQGTLWAIHDAVTGLRVPLANFYDQLSDEQRQKFAAPASAQTDPRSMTPAAIARLCGAPPATERQAQQAERQLNLDKAQRASLDAFQKKAAEMGQFLMASCLKPVASTPMERIDAAADRLTAVIFAASSVSLALNDFYNQLNNEQKSKFNSAIR